MNAVFNGVMLNLCFSTILMHLMLITIYSGMYMSARYKSIDWYTYLPPIQPQSAVYLHSSPSLCLPPPQ